MFRFSNPFPFGCLLGRELSTKNWFEDAPGRRTFKASTIARAREGHGNKLRNHVIESGQKANITNSIRRDHMRRDRMMEVERDFHIRQASSLSIGSNVNHNKAKVAADNMALARQELAKAENLWAERKKSKSLHFDEATRAKREYVRSRRFGE
jgi:hypothetical protein